MSLVENAAAVPGAGETISGATGGEAEEALERVRNLEATNAKLKEQLRNFPQVAQPFPVRQEATLLKALTVNLPQVCREFATLLEGVGCETVEAFSRLTECEDEEEVLLALQGAFGSEEQGGWDRPKLQEALAKLKFAVREAQTATDPAHRLRQLLARPKAPAASQALSQGSLGAPWEGPAFSQTVIPEGEAGADAARAGSLPAGLGEVDEAQPSRAY